jgi:hypothetical protein
MDCFLGLCSCGLHRQSGLHLRWDGAKNGDKCGQIVVVVTGPGLNDVSEPHRLEVHLHHERPLGVVHLGERRVDNVCRRLLSDLLYDVALATVGSRVTGWW